MKKMVEESLSQSDIEVTTTYVEYVTNAETCSMQSSCCELSSSLSDLSRMSSTNNSIDSRNPMIEEEEEEEQQVRRKWNTTYNCHKGSYPQPSRNTYDTSPRPGSYTKQSINRQHWMLVIVLLSTLPSCAWSLQGSLVHRSTSPNTANTRSHHSGNNRYNRSIPQNHVQGKETISTSLHLYPSSNSLNNNNYISRNINIMDIITSPHQTFSSSILYQGRNSNSQNSINQPKTKTSNLSKNNLAPHHAKLLITLTKSHTKVKSTISDNSIYDIPWNQLHDMTKQMISILQQCILQDENDLNSILNTDSTTPIATKERVYRDASQIIDETIKCITDRAFYFTTSVNSKSANSQSIRQNSWQRVKIGMATLQLRFTPLLSTTTTTSTTSKTTMHSSNLNSKQTVLTSPYNTIPRSTYVHALKALNSLLIQRNGLVGNTSMNELSNDLSLFHTTSCGQTVVEQQANAAYRILQRLCTGQGVRYYATTNIDDGAATSSSSISSSSSSSKSLSSNGKQHRPPIILDERDFSMVLNGFVTAGQMHMAHRVVALQRRTEHAPPLSAVTYSILFKGYGHLQDVKSVERVWNLALDSGVEPDIVMCNSLIGAFVNCREVDQAFKIFCMLTTSSSSSRHLDHQGAMIENYEEEEEEDGVLDTISTDSHAHSLAVWPTPNIRTFNTMLKGFAKSGDYTRALQLSQQMKDLNLWDAVTTNTLVSAFLVPQRFDLAESILVNSTESLIAKSHKRQRRKQHPNVEAYTELLDTYAKAGMESKALSVLKIMRQRNVKPNEYTYTCLVGALTKADKLEQAKKILVFMKETDGITPSIVTYNAFLSGMLSSGDLTNTTSTALSWNDKLKYALVLLKKMIKDGENPNAVTIATLVDAFGKCSPPRIEEAKALVKKLDQDGYVTARHPRVATALIRTCSNGLDFEGATLAYQNIVRPDIVALNAYLDACCRCEEIKTALHVFSENTLNFQQGRKFIKPDVISYTVLISSLLNTGKSAASVQAQQLYQDMKRYWGIVPDRGLTDVILTTMISKTSKLGRKKEEMHFTLELLNDAEQLEWEPGQYERRKRAVKSVFIKRFGEFFWKEGVYKRGLSDKQEEDPLFQKKNWNQIDSSFRLWGPAEDAKPKDEFLQKKNWNEISSGFRIF